MRVLLLNDRIPPESPGGAGQVVWRLAHGLRTAGHEVHLVAATDGPSFEEERDGFPTYHLHSRYPPRFHAYFSLFNPQTARPLRRLYARIAPDVINAHNIHAHIGYYALTLAHRMGIPTVFTSHDVMPFAYNRLRHFVDPTRCDVPSPEVYRLPRLYNLREMRFRYNPLRNVIIRHVLRHHTDVCTCVSEAHRQALETNGLPPFRVVYNGIDVEAFQVAPEAVDALRQRLELADRRVVLMAGRLRRDKGYAQILAAIDRVRQDVPNVLLLVLAAREPTLEPRFAHLRPHVRSGGWLSGQALAAAFHAADVVTVPSIIFETFSVVNIEGMAARKPVVTTCYGGPPEVVADGETGFVVNPFDTEQLAERLARLLNDKVLSQHMGEAGYTRVRARFTLRQQVEGMLTAYSDAISAHA